MSISPGYTVDEIREVVHAYVLQPHGTKGDWLAAHGLTADRMRRWRKAVFEGDLDRGLIPRDSDGMSSPQQVRAALERQRAALEREQAKERARRDREVARLRARVAELESTNDALGKAIGLLHQLSEQEPDASQQTPDPSSS